jgi:ABC-type multidrug transport system ATPase subunit
MHSLQSPPPVIEVSGLTKHYGAFKAVDDLSFKVFKGDVFGFLGQNGAGKSTTIRMLLTLIRPTAGSIRIFGMELGQHRREILSRVGAVIEKPDLYGYLSGYHNLSIFAKLSGTVCSRNDLNETLDMVGLSGRAADKVKTYSQGMKQRLGIACALVHDPDLVILDEPTNGLDPQGIADMRNLILRLSREKGKTFLISSHLLAEMELIANRMIIIDHGKKVVEGNVKELVDPEQLVLHIDTIDDATSIGKISDTRWRECLRSSNSGRIVMNVHRSDVPELVKELVGMGVGLIALRPVNSLEEYFLSRTTEKAYVEAGSN